MSFQDKSLKEKETFYKERQKFFDAVKLAKQGENPIITYSCERYKLFHLEKDKVYEYFEHNPLGKAVMFSKKYKSNVIVNWYFSYRNGFRWESENGKLIKGNLSKILCYAEIVNQNFTLGDTVDLNGIKAICVNINFFNYDRSKSERFKSNPQYISNYLLPFYNFKLPESSKCFTNGSSLMPHNSSKVVLLEKTYPFFKRNTRL